MNPKDPSDMYSMIVGYPEQFAKGLALAKNIHLSPDINEIIIAGIGGSALSPDLVYAFFQQDIRVPFSIHRSYDLPKPVSPQTLVIAISFSGNTEETISAAAAALKQGAQVAVITTGGKLSELAIANSLPLVWLTKESENFQPRMSSGYVIAVLTQLLINANILPESAATALITAATALRQIRLAETGQQIAHQLVGLTPLIYASDNYWPVARIAKIKINENSKVPCFWNIIPEMNHNEMLGFTNPQGGRYFALMLKDASDHPSINHRMEVLSTVLRGRGINSQIINMIGNNYLEKVLSSLMLMDWVSYFLALELGIDPTPVDMVEQFKAAMAK
ncbi:bifunctional phosphoglucose/phosphomannose isomerase [candidate division Kazan bacterium RIFCSPLOWO2_01_FULL_48_13]|uniref:Bifunctional phosphoglucose/phosphomannose isomerase n=1 Tax=candidate division Kazan bacterium RIFCSPLOWO2_01_FULL_48_13 TaxID=1798539 RepID=A0A1F4PPI7_UNCK3|nr:MAG: bifunctional phosphoglucose/phosphomannose isomerase [candidate division Kazan bacterium RIFCSPLOWO2_01_FULL_48_13]